MDEKGQRQYDPIKKTYLCGTVKTTEWDNVEFLENVRAAWASAVNEKIVPLGFEPIDHRNYKDQGVDRLPTVHLGTTATQMERKGIRTELGDTNRRIKARNRRVLEIERQLKGLAEEKQGLGRIIDIEHSEKAQNSPGYAHWAKLHNLKESAKVMSFLASKGITSYEQLVEVEEASRKHIESIKKQLRTLDDKIAFNGSLQRDKIEYMQTKEVFKAYKDGGRKQKFRKAHSAEIEQYEAAVARLREAEKQLGHKPPPMKELKAEHVQLKNKRDPLEAAYQEAKSERKEFSAARATVESKLGIYRNIPQNQPTSPEKPRSFDFRGEFERAKVEAAEQKVSLTNAKLPEKDLVISHDEPER